MKKIKIRFVNRLSEDNLEYYIQRKTIFGWRYFTYIVGGDAGSVYYRYSGKFKQELIKKILSDVYKTELKHVTVIEFPMIKIY